MDSNTKRQRLLAFIDWALSSGQHQVALGYVQLPQALAARERDLLKTLWTR